MKLFGVTGGIGMGKTTVARMLAQLGVAVADMDDIARQLTEPEQPALAEIEKHFGRAVFHADRSLDRGALARIVFSDDQARAKLEGILHPAIRAVWKTEVDQWRDRGEALGAVIIPLLFETGAQKDFDSVICVACAASTMQQRLRERGWSVDQIERRSAAQWPVEKKVAASDHVIWTDTTFEATQAQAAFIIGSSGKPQKTPACA